MCHGFGRVAEGGVLDAGTLCDRRVKYRVGRGLGWQTVSTRGRFGLIVARALRNPHENDTHGFQ